MKLRMEMNPLVLLLLALMILLLLPERTAEPRTFVVREESELEKRRRKSGDAHAPLRFNGRGNAPRRKSIDEQIEDADAEVASIVEGYVRKASG